MLKTVIKILFYVCAFATLVMILPGSVLLDIKPKKFMHRLPKAFEGPYKLNDRLSESSKLLDNEIIGPESIALFNNRLVTGSADGYIYEITGEDTKKRLFKLAEKSCYDISTNLTNCGRPLGLKFDSKGVLYVVEPNLGVFSIQNVFSSHPNIKQVLDIQQTNAMGKVSKFLDDLTIDEGAGLNGGDVLYISDVSTKFRCHQAILIIMGSDMGRIFKYDINARKVNLVADKLLFPNGVEITDDRNAILFNEYIARRVIKHYINGPKKGQSIELISELPGEPDNIRRSGNTKQETYWLALLSARITTKPNELDYYLKKPLLRKLCCRVLHLLGSVVHYSGQIVGNDLVKSYGLYLKNGGLIEEIVMKFESNSYGMIVEIDINGNIVNTLQTNDNTYTRLSEVREVPLNDKESVLYIGSYINNFIGKLTLKR